MNGIDSFILIGGRSTRLGEDKFALKIGGETMPERIAATIRGALPESSIYLVAADSEQVAGVEGTPATIFFDVHPGRGAWSGLHSALAHAATEWAFVIACDLPLLTAYLVNYLRSNISDDLDAVVPEQADGRLQPLMSFYRVSTSLAAVEGILAEDETPPLRVLFERLRARIVRFEEIRGQPGAADLFLNVNTRADAEKATAILDSERPFVAI